MCVCVWGGAARTYTADRSKISRSTGTKRALSSSLDQCKANWLSGTLCRSQKRGSSSSSGASASAAVGACTAPAAHLGPLEGMLHAKGVVVWRQAGHLLLPRGLGRRQSRGRFHRALRLGCLRVREDPCPQVGGVVALSRANEARRHVDARCFREALHLRSPRRRRAGRAGDRVALHVLRGGTGTRISSGGGGGGGGRQGSRCHHGTHHSHVGGLGERHVRHKRPHAHRLHIGLLRMHLGGMGKAGWGRGQASRPDRDLPCPSARTGGSLATSNVCSMRSLRLSAERWASSFARAERAAVAPGDCTGASDKRAGATATTTRRRTLELRRRRLAVEAASCTGSIIQVCIRSAPFVSTVPAGSGAAARALQRRACPHRRRLAARAAHAVAACVGQARTPPAASPRPRWRHPAAHRCLRARPRRVGRPVSLNTPRARGRGRERTCVAVNVHQVDRHRAVGLVVDAVLVLALQRGDAVSPQSVGARVSASRRRRRAAGAPVVLEWVPHQLGPAGDGRQPGGASLREPAPHAAPGPASGAHWLRNS